MAPDDGESSGAERERLSVAEFVGSLAKCEFKGPLPAKTSALEADMKDPRLLDLNEKELAPFLLT